MNPNEAFREFLKCEKGFEGCWYFLTNYYYTEKRVFDVNGMESKITTLYAGFPYLKDMARNIFEIGNVCDVKSRQILWSYTTAGVLLWFLLFADNFAGKVTSYKEEKVDDGGTMSTTDSYLGKIRFAWDRLPPVLKAPLDFKYLRIVNRLSNSYVKGESTTAKAGRGGTYNIIIADEWAFVDKSEQTFSSMHSACPNNKKLGSTPNGKGNNFARIAHLPTNESGFKVNRWHWSKNPEKTQKWYKREIRGLTKETIAREYEMSFEGSVEGRVYYMFDINKQVRKIKYNPDLPLYTTWDFGIADPTAILWLQENPNGELLLIDEYENNEQEPPFYAEIVHKKPYKTRENDIGDPAGKARGVTKKSWVSWLLECGIKIDMPIYKDYWDRIEATRKIIENLVVSDQCVGFIDCICNYRFPSADPEKERSEKPIHNWASHKMTALEYFACYRYPLRSITWRGG